MPRTPKPQPDNPERFKRWLVAGCCALSLSSCTVATFTKPGGTEAEFKTDNYECERDARMSGLGGGLASLDMRQQCMEARGYVEAH
jgi:hypothetical protein